MSGGRPTKYKAEYARMAEKHCALGATDIELADLLQVDRVTIWRWSQQHPTFCNALKAGKEAADERVARSLYAKATGYTHDAVKIFNDSGTPMVVPYREHIPPSDTAAIFWLKNRRPNEWRDKRETELSGAVELTEIKRTLVDPKAE
jgi:hypothetical protein